MIEELRDAIAKAVYESEKHEHVNRSIGGNIIEWETLKNYQKRLWRQRVEVAIDAYHALTKTRYTPLSDEEIAPHVDECNARLQAGLEQE